MQALINILKYLIKPIAIGFYLTALVTALAFYYYPNQEIDIDNKLINLLKNAHQKSVDFRLQIRGPRAGSPNVALLAIDEKAVSTVGRWPWPRETFAKAVDNAIALGAKVLAFDIVFSEPSANPTATLIQQLTADGFIKEPRLNDRLQSELTKLDSDRILAETIEKHADKIVVGAFNNTYNDEFWPAYPNLCLQANFSRSDAFKIWQNDASGIIHIDNLEITLPDILVQFYQQRFSEIDEQVRKNLPPAKNTIEEHDIEIRVANEIANYCLRWLDPKEDEFYSALEEAWPLLRENYPDSLKEETFAKWVENIRNNYMPISTKNSLDWVMNIKRISEKAKNTAYFNAYQDSDGSVRRNSLVARTAQTWFPSLPLKAFLVANNYSLQMDLTFDDALNRKVISKMTVKNDEGEDVFDIPTNTSGQMAINYAGKQKMFAHMSIADLLSDAEQMEIWQRTEVAPGRWDEQAIAVNKKEWIKDKIFIVGATATGIYDLRVTPFDENFPGPETHVNVIDNLLRRDFLKTSPLEERYMLLFLPIAGLLLSIALTYLGAVSGALLTIGSVAGVALVDRFFIFGNGIVTVTLFPQLLIAVLYVGLTFYKYFTEERGKKELRATFQKYVSPAIVEEILSDPSNIELGGRKMRLTVFFSDVRGFTTISEKLDPRALSDLLNSYLTPMTDLVFKNKGTLDKYMGDAIMAFFGAPIAYPDHARWACRCALAHLEKLRELQEMLKRQGLPTIDIGIGLNTGEVSVGNMGSETVRSYTVMGDSVNLASRLEGINKTYGTRIIISEFTYADIKDEFICREVDWVRVKGKELPVKIFELIAEKTAPQRTMSLLKQFESGYKMYHEKQFEKAAKVFEEALAIDAEDYLSKVYLERCQEFIAEPPPNDWDGVFVMKTK